jgi:hypothetical protein
VFHESLGLPVEAERPKAADRRTDGERNQRDHRELGIPMKHRDLRKPQLQPKKAGAPAA